MMLNESNGNLPIIGGIALVTIILFGGLVWLLTSVSSSEPPIGNGGSVTFNDSDAPRLGPADAKVTVHIYGDLQCPACKSAEGPLRLAEEKYQDRVAFVWKDFPLMQIHPNARPAANAARCAEAQGKFWEYHDKLYDDQESWSVERDPTENFVGYASAFGLDASAFRSCYADRTFDGSKVMRDVAEATRNAVDRTPTFFINNRRVFGMSPADWYLALDAALLQAGVAAPSASVPPPEEQATSTGSSVVTSTVPAVETSTP